MNGRGRMLRARVLAAGLVAFSLVIASCSGDDDEAGTDGDKGMIDPGYGGGYEPAIVVGVGTAWASRLLVGAPGKTPFAASTGLSGHPGGERVSWC